MRFDERKNLKMNWQALPMNYAIFELEQSLNSVSA